MTNKKFFLKVLFLVCAICALCGQAWPQSYPYTHIRLIDLNKATQYPCGQTGTPTTQIQTSLGILADYGGTVDLTCYQTPITITADIFSSVAVPITLILPPTTVSLAANVTIPSNFQVCPVAGSALTTTDGFALTNNAATCTAGPGGVTTTTSGWGFNFLPPARPTGAYAYLFGVNDGGGASSGWMSSSGAAYKTYAIGVLVNRPTADAVTGDSNDAILKGTYNNYAANDANFIMRGVNTVVNNRSGGTLGTLEGGVISASCKSGATCPFVNALTASSENYGTNATQHSAIDAIIHNEGAKATLEFGVRVRNIDNSTTNAADAAFLVASSSGYTNHGFSFGLDLNGATIGSADIRLSTGVWICTGSAVTRDAARAACNGAIGSLYLGTGGHNYLRVANGGITTDFEKITTSAAD